MVVPTLPVIGIAPPFELFQAMNWTAIALGYVLVIAAVVSTLVLLKPLLIPIMYCIKPSRRTPKHRGLSSCRRCMNSVFLFAGRWLCVQTFPALFKMHKTRSDHGSQTREFIVFLDRSVEVSVQLIAAFCSIVCCIFFISAAVFFQYFPVEESTECVETDNHGRTLFCYSNSSLPVDCANFSVTELRELRFQCYAIALPAGLGIAIAVALALAKVGIMAVTILVKLMEGFFTMTKNPQKLPQCCCCCCRLPYANKVCVYSSIALFVIASVVLLSCSIIASRKLPEMDRKQSQHFLYYYAYRILSVLICVPLVYIVLNLEVHCSRGEYISIAADQRPPDPRDWDVESGTSIKAGHNIANSMLRESGNISDVPDESLKPEATLNSLNLDQFDFHRARLMNAQ